MENVSSKGTPYKPTIVHLVRDHEQLASVEDLINLDRLNAGVSLYSYTTTKSLLALS